MKSITFLLVYTGSSGDFLIKNNLRLSAGIAVFTDKKEGPIADQSIAAVAVFFMDFVTPKDFLNHPKPDCLSAWQGVL